MKLLSISSLDPPLINASTDYDYNERVFVIYMFISLSTNLKLSIDIFIMSKLIKHALISWSLATLKNKNVHLTNEKKLFF